MVSQYTVRGIPPAVDRALRKRAHRNRRSLNATIIEVLAEWTSSSTGSRDDHSVFDELFGADTLDDGFDDAVKSLSQPDPTLWS